MRVMKAVFVSCFLGGLTHISGAGAQQLVEKGASSDCGAYSQAEMRTCLMSASESSAAALRSATISANEAIAKWDESPKYVSVARIRLSEANSAFEKYRAAQCNWSVAIGGGAIGNALEIRRHRCISDMNTARIAQIKAMVEELPLRNPTD